MRYYRFGASMLALAGLLLCLTMVGCGGNKDDEDDDVPGPRTRKPGIKKREPLPPSTAVVKGRVTFSGGKPDLAKLTAEVETQMKKTASTTLHCLTNAPEDQKGQQLWRINESNQGVADAVVFLVPANPRETFFSAAADTPGVVAAKKDAVMDQPHCAFLPRVLVHFPAYLNEKGKSEKTGQKFIVKNSAAITHNTSLAGGSKNSSENTLIPSGGEIVLDQLKADTVPLGVSCTIHGWMKANVWVLDHPYFAITDKDGNFEIKNAPEGEVNITAWHPGQPGNFLVETGYKGVPITLKKDAATEKNFEARAQ